MIEFKSPQLSDYEKWIKANTPTDLEIEKRARFLVNSVITKEYLIPYLTFVKENKRVFKLIHEKPHIFDNNGLNKKLYEDTFSLILDKYNVKENEKQYIFLFYTTGTLSIVLKWLENDCKDEIEFISNIIIKIINQAR